MHKITQRIAAFGASCLLASGALAQTNFPEVEPNSLKTEANAVTGITAGDTISGTSTGTTTTAGLTTAVTVDVFRVKTAALPLGIYRHQLTLTTAVVGHIGTIRGVNQTGTAGTASTGGLPGTVDSTVQTTSTTTTPPRFNQWYAFGKQEEIYYRVSGAAATTAAYTATLSTAAVPATVVTQPFESGSAITITSVAQTTANTMIHVFDANLNAIPGASNNDEGPAGPTTQSRLVRTFAPGTYYVAIGIANMAWDFRAPPDDDVVTGLLMDLPGSLVCASTATTAQDLDFAIAGSNGIVGLTAQLPAGSPYEILWFQFTTTSGAPPIISPPPPNDNCASATALAATAGTVTGTVLGATNDGAATCDPGGASARDVWYSWTNTNATLRLLGVTTCGTTGVNDTVVSVYNGCGGLELACSDNCGGTPCAGPSSCVSGITVNPAQTVLVRVSDKGLGGQLLANFTLVTTVTAPPPPNDDCSTPIVLPGPGLYPFDTTAATTGTQGQGPTPACMSTTTPVQKDLWYTYTATATGTVTFSTCMLVTSANDDTKISYYLGAGCPASASPIGCDDDSCVSPGLNTILTFPIACGDVFTIQFGNYSTSTAVNITGNFSVTETGTVCGTPPMPFCLGDGTGAPCPCMPTPNNGAAGHGCASVAFAAGAILSTTGFPSDETTGTDTLVLTATNVPGPALFIQSDGLGGTVSFGDGQLCATVSIIRLGVVFPGPPANPANVASYPGGLTPNEIHIQGFAVNGQTKHYQAWYRSVPGVCTAGQNFNLTQGLSITWQM